MTTEKSRSSSWEAAISQLPGYPREAIPQPAVPQAPARTVTPMKADDETEEGR